MTTKTRHKIDIEYICKKCNYITSRKKNYSSHILTAKHNKTTNGLQHIFAPFECECNKIYSCRQNLHRHKMNCVISRQNKTKLAKPTLGQYGLDIPVSNVNPPDLITLIQDNAKFKELLYIQSKQLHETQVELLKSNEQNIDIHNRLIDVFKDGTTVNNTTNNNQKFNLNFFLNTTCKDAMNMSEFIENLQVDFKDIENIGKQGYVSGMTNMILSRITELDITKRPLHCTDIKRETMYIKDNDEWCKDNSENEKLRDMISIVAKQNHNIVPLWRNQHPECNICDHPSYNLCMDMMRNVIGDVGSAQDRLDNKVIKNISRHIFIK